MTRFQVILWLTLLATAGTVTAQDTPILKLSATPPTPYAGELVEILLQIQHPPSAVPLELNIPWLRKTASFLELPLQQWFCQHSRPTAQALPLHLAGQILYARQVTSGTYVLTWHWRMTELPEEEANQFLLTPVTLGRHSSNALSLEVRPLPTPPPSRQVWHLGTGVFHVTARWQTPTVVLGEEALLELTVAGKSLDQLPAPPLGQLPGWENDRFLLEAAPETWQNGQRIFRYRVRPRQLRSVAPPVLLRFFDPLRGSVVTQQLVVPPLQVLTSSHGPPGTSLEDAFRHLTSSEQHLFLAEPARPAWWFSLVPYLGSIPVGWLILVILRLGYEKLFPHWIRKRRWIRARRKASAALFHADSRISPTNMRQILSNYLSEGLNSTISSDWESLYRVTHAVQPELLPMLQLLQQWEFGPFPQEAEFQVFQLAELHYQAGDNPS